MAFALNGYLLAIASILLTIFINKKLIHFPTVSLDEDQYWGPGIRPEIQDQTLREFKINISEKVLLYLKYRVANARPLPLSLLDVHHQYGINVELMEDVLYFWNSKYDWKKKREPHFNKFPHYKTNIQGLDIHYIHEKPKNEKNLKVVPILLLHGWPGSFLEFYHIIPHLTNPLGSKKFAFEVIVPSLPGFGFSEAASKPGLGAAQMAVVLHNLMKRIGFQTYYIQGGDWGSIIGGIMSSKYPESVLGFHSTMCFTMERLPNLLILLGSLFPSFIVEKKFEDRVYPLSKIYSRLIEETGYLHLQATKPDTLGVALTDSPVGLAAYILEKFVDFTDAKLIDTKLANLRNSYGYEALLDNIVMYWITGTITTSMRLYAETFNPSHFALGWLNQPITVPSACSRFKNEIAFQPESILKYKFTNLVVLRDHEVGGHFASMEVPTILANDIWFAVDTMEKYHRSDEK
ncbi:Jheh2 [Trypoxylus dichotomus]